MIMFGGQPITGLNVPIEVFGTSSCNSIERWKSSYFGNDVLKQMERKTGFL